jgi:hypothetical protein
MGRAGPNDAAHGHDEPTPGSHIGHDVRCRECGYCLRGLSYYGLCPECATPVQLSLGGSDLYTASLRWLRRLRRGFWLTKFALAILLLSLIASTVAVALSSPSAIPLSWLASALLLASGIALPVAIACALVGFVLATQPEPIVRALGEGLSARRLARYLVLISALMWATMEFISAVVPSNAVIDVVMMVLPHCAVLAGLAAAIAFARYVGYLLKRTPETKPLKLAEEIVTLASLALLFVAIGVVGQVALPFVQAGAPQLAEVLNNLVRFTRISSCCSFIVVIGLLSLVWQMSGVLGHTLARAEEYARERGSDNRSERL